MPGAQEQHVQVEAKPAGKVKQARATVDKLSEKGKEWLSRLKNEVEKNPELVVKEIAESSKYVSILVENDNVTIQLNNVLPPDDFKKENSWEIKEREVVKILKSSPDKSPVHDDTTEYKVVEGPARYIVERERLGKGGMADVYRAWDSRLGRYVAVKELKPIHNESESLKNNIELEAKIIARLKNSFHQGIPHVYDHIISKTFAGDRSFMIMELIEGESLIDKSFRLEGKLSSDEIKTIIAQTADTIDFINKKGFPHGDIKPENVICSDKHIKIIDYGSILSEGQVDRTPGYSAPELDNNIRDSRSDEYSFVMTVASIILPRITPSSLKEVGIRYYIERSNYFEGMSEEKKVALIKIFEKGYADNPDDRYQSSTEFAQDFNKYF